MLYISLGEIRKSTSLDPIATTFSHDKSYQQVVGTKAQSKHNCAQLCDCVPSLLMKNKSEKITKLAGLNHRHHPFPMIKLLQGTVYQGTIVHNCVIVYLLYL